MTWIQPSEAICPHCDEPIELAEVLEKRVMTLAGGVLIHFECVTRMVAGSVSHQLGRCICNGGTEEDPPNMTKREAAREALHVYRTIESRRN